jgi:2'-5' RNA ligase
LRVVRQGVEQSDRLEELRAVIGHAIQRAQCEPV